MSDEKLPVIFEKSEDMIMKLTNLIAVPREVLPSKDKIDSVLQQLPSLLNNIRHDLCDEKIAKMCIAVGVGLFDSAINYVWNQTIIEIRKRVNTFGLDIVKQLKNKEYTACKELLAKIDVTLLEPEIASKVEIIRKICAGNKLKR